METLYHCLWLYRAFGRTITLTDGRRVEVVAPGIHNPHAGPDFSDARLRFNGNLWAGNVEIHIRTSDWYFHGHDSDPAYDNVLLHVAASEDAPVCRKDGSPVPTFITGDLPPNLLRLHSRLSRGLDNVRCLPDLVDLHPLILTDALESLAMERLHAKADAMRTTLHALNGDWDRTLFIFLARALGFGLNGTPFELLARSVPLNFLYRHADNPLQIEALLFGQAGMLDRTLHPDDEYFLSLCREYDFLAAKYSLKPIDRSLWKLSRTRPQNFPHRRIAVFAAAVCSGVALRELLSSADPDPATLSPLFAWEASPYWGQHSAFGSPRSATPLARSLSASSIDVVILNLVPAFLFAYAAERGIPEYAERGISLLMNMKPESNSVISQWRRGGVRPKDALHTQALIQLRRNYCDRRRCMDCRLGQALIRGRYGTPSPLTHPLITE